LSLHSREFVFIPLSLAHCTTLFFSIGKTFALFLRLAPSPTFSFLLATLRLFLFSGGLFSRCYRCVPEQLVPPFLNTFLGALSTLLYSFATVDIFRFLYHLRALVQNGCPLALNFPLAWRE